MAFGRQMRDHVGTEVRDRGTHRAGIADIAPNEPIALRRCDRLDRRQRAGIGQLVEIEHIVLAVFDQMPDQCGTDEPGPAGDENTHGNRPQASGVNGRPS